MSCDAWRTVLRTILFTHASLPWARIHCASAVKNMYHSRRTSDSYNLSLCFIYPTQSRSGQSMFFTSIKRPGTRGVTCHKPGVKRFHSSEIRLLGAFHQTTPSIPFHDATVFHLHRNHSPSTAIISLGDCMSDYLLRRYSLVQVCQSQPSQL